MCGITGFSASPSFVPVQASLDRSLTNLLHRGPDDSGTYVDANFGIGLGHSRLSILELSPLGCQPMTSTDGRVTLVFNGEIYNFQELRAELEVKGYVFRGHSDTEVLLNLYLAQRQSSDGEYAMLNQLNGIFTFAIWDADRELLFLARDSFGVKPLYYSATRGVFAVASEIKALQPLLSKCNVKRKNILSELDATAINRYLSFQWCPGDGTPLKGVHKLNPGTAMWVRRGQIEKLSTWYKLPAFRGQSEGLSKQAAIMGTCSLLRKAVQRQMVADVPVGAFLSGGLDSSSIVAFAREVNPDICCFTIEANCKKEDGIIDDLPYARQVATHLKVPLEVVNINAACIAKDLPDMVAQLDEPLADPAALNVLYISRIAREHGIKVLLSGVGGDDLFTGYRRHQALMMEGFWSWLPKPARAGIELLTGHLDQHRTLFRRLHKMFNGASLEGDARLVNYFRWVNQRDLMTLYTPEFRSALDLARSEDPMIEFLKDLPPETSQLERMLSLEQRFFLTDHNLTYTDKMSMAVGVEVRVPFLDLDLVEFAARIPAHFKQLGNEGKWVLKKAMEPYLPKDVIYRSKSGFGAPLRRWMRIELRDLLTDLLGANSLRNRGLFDPVAIQRMIQANDHGKIDASYTLFSLMCIELWCRRFIDQNRLIPSNF